MPRLRPPTVPGSSEIVVAKYRTLPEDTGTIRQNPTHFQPGQSGNPAGRPRGSRNKLGEQFLHDLVTIWDVHGPAAIAKVAATEPTQFVKIVASILPREVVSMALTANVNVDLGIKAKASSFLTVWNNWRAENGEPEPSLTDEAAIAFKLDDDD